MKVLERTPTRVPVASPYRHEIGRLIEEAERPSDVTPPQTEMAFIGKGLGLLLLSAGKPKK